MPNPGNRGGVPEFELPEEILAVVPTDPYDQLDLARKITSMAIASRVSSLETDVSRLKQELVDKERLVFELEEKVCHIQRSFEEAESRLNVTLDENMKISKERDSLAITVRKLTRDLAKLESFKRQLMQSLQDDDNSSSQAETVDIVTCNQSVPRAYPSIEEGTNGHITQSGSRSDKGSRYSGQKFSITPYISPRLTPTGTPKIFSASVSPRGYSAAGSPKRTSGSVTPTKSQYDGRASLSSSCYPSSQQSSAANSPPHGRTVPAHAPKIDGKEFFRQARSRLSYEQFSAFLANIKELNSQRQTREETIRKTEELFGAENKDLFLSFKGLLNRNMR